MIQNTKIPKIIHYCWFGKTELPAELKACVDTWHKNLKDYQIMCWNEDNCTFDENEFVKSAYEEKQWAFVSDFYRIKALAEYGGIYLDTDVVVYKDFLPLLSERAFLSFNYDCTIGTAVIGAEPHNPFILGILSMYERTYLCEKKEGKYLEEVNGQILSYGYNTNNYYFTYYVLKKYPQFMLNNCKQNLIDIVIYPKEDFEIGRLNKSHYTIHLNDGSWHKENNVNGVKEIIKGILSHNKQVFDFVMILVRKRRYKKANKKLPFYNYSIAQIKGQKLPEL